MTRFLIRMDRWWRPLLLPFGATQENSFVDVHPHEVHFRFGFLFDRTIPRSEIVSVCRRDWPWWGGIGWRSNFRGLIGLVGSSQGVVEVELEKRQRVWGVFPCDRIAVSVHDPDALVAALEGTETQRIARTAASAARKQAASKARTADKPGARKKSPTTRARKS